MSFLPIFRTVLGGALSVGLTATALAAQPLKLEVYNPGKNSVFPVSSEIVVGDKDALLIDAQFQRNDAQALVEKIKATGKKLTTVYISHSDPDYYFGLDVIRSAFPEARIVATQATVDAIQASKDGKLAHWGPILKDNAPQSLVVPEVLGERGLTVDGRKLDIVGPNPARTVVWIPSIRAVVGGVPVSANIHVWVADTQTPASRQSWLQTLDAIDALHPRTVVPGHYLPDADGKLPHTPASVKFTRGYLQTFEQEAAKSTDAAALIARMKQRYPQLGESSSLDLGAKVIKGEMKWPQ